MIRVMETAKSYPVFVYDTLTWNESSKLLQQIDITDIVDSLSWDKLDSESQRIISQYYLDDCLVPIFPKKIFSQWIKRGRELYNWYHRKAIKEGRMERIKLKYLACLEYGPASSRPHVHLVMFGISPKDYKDFFAKPWRQNCGFTKTKYIDQRVRNREKDLVFISQYISKYITKGEFESTLVKDGIQPAPWRLLSHGLGEEYLDRKKDFFAWRYTDLSKFKYQLTGVDWQPWFNPVTNKWEPKRYTASNSSVTGFDLWDHFDLSQVESLEFSKDDLVHLMTYYDDKGFPHALPRYYRDKLLGRDPNYLRYEVQSFILQDACERCYQEIQAFAPGIERVRPDQFRSITEVEQLLRSFDNLAFDRYFAWKTRQRLRQVAGHFVKLKNHYTRSYVGEIEHFSPF